MRISLLRSVIRRDPSSKHWADWTGKKGGERESDELWTKWSLPSLLFPTLFRQFFPHWRNRFSQETSHRANLGISIFYVLFGASFASWCYAKYKARKNEQYLQEEQDIYYHRINARESYRHDPNHTFKSVKISWSGIETKDVTDQVRDNIEKELGCDVDDPEYDKYKDEKYVRARMRISPDDDKFDLAYSGALLRRKDKRNLAGPFARSPMGMTDVGHK